MVKSDRAESARPLSRGAFGIARLCSVMLLVATTASWAQVMLPNSGSVPSGPATDLVLRLTLSEAVNRAVRYNLGAIESQENTREARGQRLLALSHLLPQVSAGVQAGFCHRSMRRDCSPPNINHRFIGEKGS
jgi:outer membrane protein TolC